jgi:SAM-dependent methyltransferase
MVVVARRRNVGATNVEVAVLDATSIDRDDGSFDAVACRMGLMFAPDPAIALGEIRRVLDSGGRFAALTWAGMERNPWMTCVGMAAAMHGVAAGPPPVAAGGVFSLGDEEQLRALARSARFADVEVTALPTVFEAPDIDTHLARVSSLAGPLAAAFAAATPAQLDAVRETAAQLTAEHARDDGALALPGCALLLTARA